MPDEPKQYFAERHGRGPKTGPLTIGALRRLVFSVWDSFGEAGRLQESFGFYCVDASTSDSWVPGDLGADPTAYFLRTLGVEDVWPYRDHEDAYDDPDTLLSMVEVIHDLVSEPVEGHFHSFANCGMHYH